MLRDQNKINELLLFFLRSETNPTDFQIKDISDSDWDGFVQESIRQRIGGLLYQRLKSLPPDNGIPSRVIQELRQQYFDTALRNMQLFHELHKVLEALQESDVSVIVLKGAYLAQGVYGNIALRSMGDVDILVRKEDFAKAEQMLLDRGYSFDEQYGERDWYLNNHYHLLYRRPENGVNIELHWDITSPSSPFEIDVERLWERAQLVTIAGAQVLVFSAEDLILYLCLHLSYHHTFEYFAMRSLYDVNEILLYYCDNFDWWQLQELARKWSATNSAFLTLYLARELLGATVPEAVLKDLEPQNIDPRFIHWAEERMFIIKDTQEATQKPSLSGRFARVYTSQGLASKISAFLLTLFPPLETMAELYSLQSDSTRIYFYYPVRLLDVFRSFTSIGWQLLRGDQKIIAWIDSEGKRSALKDWLTPQN